MNTSQVDKAVAKAFNAFSENRIEDRRYFDDKLKCRDDYDERYPSILEVAKKANRVVGNPELQAELQKSLEITDTTSHQILYQYAEELKPRLGNAIKNLEIIKTKLGHAKRPWYYNKATWFAFGIPAIFALIASVFRRLAERGLERNITALKGLQDKAEQIYRETGQNVDRREIGNGHLSAHEAGASEQNQSKEPYEVTQEWADRTLKNLGYGEEGDLKEFLLENLVLPFGEDLYIVGNIEAFNRAVLNFLAGQGAKENVDERLQNFAGKLINGENFQTIKEINGIGRTSQKERKLKMSEVEKILRELGFCETEFYDSIKQEFEDLVGEEGGPGFYYQGKNLLSSIDGILLFNRVLADVAKNIAREKDKLSERLRNWTQAGSGTQPITGTEFANILGRAVSPIASANSLDSLGSIAGSSSGVSHPLSSPSPRGSIDPSMSEEGPLEINDARRGSISSRASSSNSASVQSAPARMEEALLDREPARLAFGVHRYDGLNRGEKKGVNETIKWMLSQCGYKRENIPALKEMSITLEKKEARDILAALEKHLKAEGVSFFFAISQNRELVKEELYVKHFNSLIEGFLVKKFHTESSVKIRASGMIDFFTFAETITALKMQQKQQQTMMRSLSSV